VLLHLVLGIALGVASGILPGPCGLAVMTTAANRGLHRALAVAAGGGLGDGTYALLGTIAIAPLVARHPFVPTLLHLASGIALISFGLARLRPRSPTSVRSNDLAGGFAIGIASVLSNPGALLSWATVVGAILGRASTLTSVALVVGIGAGSALWLTALAAITHARRSSRVALVQRVGVVVSALLIASGALALVRAAHACLAP
jgi:threonine/homoserine/homoserine lactone efflux protein